MDRSEWIVIVALLVLLPLAAAPFLGWWTLAVPALVLPLAAARRLAPRDGAVWGRVATALGLLGGGLGVFGAATALAEVGRQAPYDERAAFGVAALALAGLAMAGGALASARPRPAAGLLALGAAAGTLAMGLFWIDSWYVAALPPCWLAAALALLQPRRGAPAPRPQPGGGAGAGRSTPDGGRSDTSTPRQTRRQGSTIEKGNLAMNG